MVQNENGKEMKTDLSNGQLYMDDDDEDSEEDEDDGAKFHKIRNGAKFLISKMTNHLSVNYARYPSKPEICYSSTLIIIGLGFCWLWPTGELTLD